MHHRQLSSPSQRNQQHAQLRVLFLHGLESGPRGRKVLHLKQFFDVHCEDMNIRQYKSPRHNPWVAVALCWLMLIVGVVLVSIFKLDLVHLIFASPFMVEMVMIAALASAVLVILYRLAVRYAVNCCIAQQVEALTLYRPDVVVGSSFGGAIAVFMLVRGLWSGPTLLLAPAQALVAKHAAWPNPAIDRALQPFSRAPPRSRGRGPFVLRLERLLVIHGRYDRVVPCQHSVDLVNSWRAAVNFNSAMYDNANADTDGDVDLDLTGQAEQAVGAPLPPGSRAGTRTNPDKASLPGRRSTPGAVCATTGSAGSYERVDSRSAAPSVIPSRDNSGAVPCLTTAGGEGGDADDLGLLARDRYADQEVAHASSEAALRAALPWIQLDLIEDDHPMRDTTAAQLKHWVLSVCFPDYEQRARARQLDVTPSGAEAVNSSLQ